MYRSEYEKNPTKIELFEYMDRNGIDSTSIIGWSFYLPEKNIIASKNAVLTDSGKRVDIIINDDLTFDVHRD